MTEQVEMFEKPVEKIELYRPSNGFEGNRRLLPNYLANNDARN